MLSGFMKLGDDGGKRITDAGDFLKAVFCDQLVYGKGAEGEVFRRPAVGPRPVGVPALQDQAVADFAQQSGDFRGGKTGHGYSLSVSSTTANRLVRIGFNPNRR